MYTRKDVINEINKAVNGIYIAELYKERCINWNGKTTDTQELYAEVIAGTLYNAGIVNRFDKGITTIWRVKSFNANHQGTTSAKQIRKDEARYAIALYNWSMDSNGGYKNLGSLGVAFDYQVPLKNKQSDVAGKIDLISYDEKSNTIYLIELKKKDNVETLIRCTLEIETYYRQVDKVKIITDFKCELSKISSKDLETANFKTAILIFEDSRQHEVLKKISNLPNVKNLISGFGTSIFVISSHPSKDIGIDDDPSLLPGVFKPVLTPLGIIPTVSEIIL